jgi:hypothetical protein
VLTKDGTIDQIEVRSASDKAEDLLARMRDTRSKLPLHMQGRTDLKEITKKGDPK